jgi:glycine cleavage system aminomethyltransferase T
MWAPQVRQWSQWEGIWRRPKAGSFAPTSVTWIIQPGVEIGHERVPEEMEEFWSIHAAGREVGYVTNAVWSRRLEKNIRYAWVPIELAVEGTTLQVEWPFGEPAKATVVRLPFHRSREGHPGWPRDARVTRRP